MGVLIWLAMLQLREFSLGSHYWFCWDLRAESWQVHHFCFSKQSLFCRWHHLHGNNKMQLFYLLADAASAYNIRARFRLKVVCHCDLNVRPINHSLIMEIKDEKEVLPKFYTQTCFIKLSWSWFHSWPHCVHWTDVVGCVCRTLAGSNCTLRNVECMQFIHG